MNKAVDPVSSPPRLWLLGQFRLEFGAEPVELCRNAQRLLAFVGLRGRVSRTVLAGILWPEVTEEHARGSLRTALWKLPRGDQPLVHGCGDWLVASETMQLDVHTFTETALGVVQGYGSPLPGRLPLGLVGAEDLLPGWDEDWVRLERERLRQLRLHALDALAEALVRQGKPALALEAAWASVRTEPLRESAHRVVVSVHLAEGNLSEALLHYQAFRQLLNEELGVEPSPQFTRMLPVRQGHALREHREPWPPGRPTTL